MSNDSHDRNQPVPPLSRRAFIKGAGAAAAVAGFIAVRPGASAADTTSPQPPAEGIAERLGPGPETIELTVNGATRKLKLEPRVTLLEVLRDHLGLYGTKTVCGRGACGACTVHLDGHPVTSCLILAADARGHEITTIEGLGDAHHMHPVQAAFVASDALQCGFCTPGMVMAVTAALKHNSAPTLDQIKHAVSGNTCRCGAYPHIFKAALAAAAEIRGAKPLGENT